MFEELCCRYEFVLIGAFCYIDDKLLFKFTEKLTNQCSNYDNSGNILTAIPQHSAGIGRGLGERDGAQEGTFG